MATLGIPKEIHPGEKRVAATPQTILKLQKLGFDVAVEAGAGHAVNASNGEYREAGATVIDDTRELWAASDLVMKVRPPEENEDTRRPRGRAVEGRRMARRLYLARTKREMLDRLAERKATVFGMDCVPRITRAQKMDTLSAMANIAGYRAVIEAANNFPRFFTGQITAAGRIDPGKGSRHRCGRRRSVGDRCGKRLGRDRSGIRSALGDKRSGRVDGCRVSRARRQRGRRGQRRLCQGDVRRISKGRDGAFCASRRCRSTSSSRLR